MAISPLKFGFTHLTITFQFQQDGNQGPLPLTTNGLAGGTPLANNALGVTWNGVDLATSALIKRTGTGTWTVLAQSGGSLGQATYQVSAADVSPTGTGPWNFELEAYATFPDGTVAISDNIQGPQIVPRLAAS